MAMNQAEKELVDRRQRLNELSELWLTAEKHLDTYGCVEAVRHMYYSTDDSFVRVEYFIAWQANRICQLITNSKSRETNVRAVVECSLTDQLQMAVHLAALHAKVIAQAAGVDDRLARAVAAINEGLASPTLDLPKKSGRNTDGSFTLYPEAFKVFRRVMLQRGGGGIVLPRQGLELLRDLGRAIYEHQGDSFEECT